MKVSIKAIAGLAAVALMTACSNDEPVVPGDSNAKPVGQQTYMDVNIQSAADSRAATGDFNDGTMAEHQVSSARFFFFDSDGLYWGSANKWTPSNTTEPDNVEYMGESTIVLDNVESNQYPTYLFTVLNAPDFEPESTLKATAAKLLDYSVKVSGEKYFVMSTTSFKGKPASDGTHYDDTYYYATVLQSSDFKTSPTDATATPVNVYVERLAAKVEVLMNASNKNGAGVYPLHVSVMGNVNGSIDETTASTEVGVKILGWELSGTADESYIGKQLADDWTATSTDPFTGWNNADRFRSYWAMSKYYGETDPTSVLGYKKWTELGLDFEANNYTYCNEYTNTKDNVTKTTAADGTKVEVAKTTHVMIKAQLTDLEGNPMKAIKYNGYLFTYDRYKDYVLSEVDRGTGNLNLYTCDAAKNEYKQVDCNHFDFVLATDESLNGTDFETSVAANKLAGVGKVVVVPALKEGVQYYTKNGANDYVTVETATAKTTLMQQLAAAQTIKAEAINEAMYYTIAVKHNPDFEDTAEAKYGVVRNHWYEVSVNAITQVGHGLFDPENEVIIPEGPEDDKFFLATRIKVLSWRIIRQNEDL